MEICHIKTRTAANQKSKLVIDRLEPFTQTPEGQMSRGESNKITAGDKPLSHTFHNYILL
jgi:hypothetical protein